MRCLWLKITNHTVRIYIKTMCNDWRRISNYSCRFMIHYMYSLKEEPNDENYPYFCLKLSIIKIISVIRLFYCLTLIG